MKTSIPHTNPAKITITLTETTIAFFMSSATGKPYSSPNEYTPFLINLTPNTPEPAAIDQPLFGLGVFRQSLNARVTSRKEKPEMAIRNGETLAGNQFNQSSTFAPA